MKMALFLRRLTVSAIFCIAAVASGEDNNGPMTPAPEKLSATRTTYTRATLNWQPGDSLTQLSGYKVYRDGVCIATVSTGEYVDSGLQAGRSYTYKVTALGAGGAESGFSEELPVRTIGEILIDGQDAVAAAVDSLHELSLSGLTEAGLPADVTSKLEERLGSAVSWTLVDRALLADAAGAQLNLMSSACPQLSDAEKRSLKQALNELMNDSFSGNSFEHLYARETVARIAEDHYKSGNIGAAVELHKLALRYLADDEDAVFGTLVRLAYLRMQALPEKPTRQELLAALAESRDFYLQFFQFFPESATLLARRSYCGAADLYFRQFPVLLTYDNYDTTAFATARGLLAQAAAGNENSTALNLFTDRVDAWELVPVVFNFRNTADAPRNGTVKVTNISAEQGLAGLFPAAALADSRTFQFSGELTIPLYKGHLYRVEARFPMNGSGDLIYDIPVFAHDKGAVYNYDYMAPAGSGHHTGSSPTGETRADFIVDTEGFPYNLRVDFNIDRFNISWEWCPAPGFRLKCFKVLRGSEVIAETDRLSVSDLPLTGVGDICTYSVVAYDVDGNPSQSSPVVSISAADQPDYAGFFAWMRQYFGDQPMYAGGDPDLDGVDNYHEFLNGTDPTMAPGPRPLSGQRGYSFIIVNWNPSPSETPETVYEVECGDGTAATITEISGHSLTVSDLQPGDRRTFRLRLRNAAGAITDWSEKLVASTLVPNTFTRNSGIAAAVDELLPMNAENVTSDGLIQAMAAKLSSGGSASPALAPELRQIVASWLASGIAELGREALPDASNGQWLADELKTGWNGKAFEDVYIGAALADLAEQYYQAYLRDRTLGEYPAFASMLLDASLYFMADNPRSVSNALARMAAMRLQQLTQESTGSEIALALAEQAAIRMRFPEFFRDFDYTDQLLSPYRGAAVPYLEYFPRLLKYDNYNTAGYNAAVELANKWFNFYPDETCRQFKEKIEAWALTSLAVQISMPSGSAEHGVLTIANSSCGKPDSPVLYSSGFNDIREFELTGEPLTIPVYAGHTYDITVGIPVAGGPIWTHRLNNLNFGNGRGLSYNGSEWEESDDGAKLVFPEFSPQFPYNLKAVKNGSAFSLNWSWSPPAGYVPDHFNIYRGTTLIGTSATGSFGPIALAVNADSVYTYSVTAVDADGHESLPSQSLEVLPPFSAEESAYYRWKLHCFGAAAVNPDDDFDGDGLSNYQEYLLGSDPTQAPPENPLDALSRMIPGAVVNYYAGVFLNVPSFDGMKPYKSVVLTDLDQPSTTGEVLNSGRTNDVAVEINGYFETEQDGFYRFYLENDDGAILMIDNGVLISHDRMGLSEGYEEIHLSKGVHALKIKYFQRLDCAALRVTWAGPGFARRNLGSSLWHTDDDEKILAEVVAWQRDSDFDGIPDIDERRYGTDPANPDTDDDGLTDYEEIYVYGTNPLLADTDSDSINDAEEVKYALSSPLVADFDGRKTILQTLNGSAGKPLTGAWEADGNALFCGDRSGSVNYTVELPAAGVYVLELLGGEKNPLIADSSFTLGLQLNGRKLGEREIRSVNQADGQTRFYLPQLNAGPCTLTVVWRNVKKDTSLKISSVQLIELGGPDRDGNGRADWIDHRLSALSELDLPATSFTSPLCVEGAPGSFESGRNISVTADHAGTVNLPLTLAEEIIWRPESAEPPEGAERFRAVIQPGVNGSFYADIPLSPSGDTRIALSADGIEDAASQVRWVPINVLTAETITVRAGDSLLLCADLGSDVPGEGTITVQGQQLSIAQGTAVEHKFPEAGTWSVTAEFVRAEGGHAASGELTVKVVGAAFANPPYGITGLECTWKNPAIPSEAILEYDPMLTVFRADRERGCDIVFYGKQPGSGIMTARLGSNGPIMASTRVNVLDCSTHKEDGYYKIIDIFPDGDKLIEGKIVLSGVPADMRIHLVIYTSGTTFLDGTVEKWLTTADFDENGVCRYQMVKSPDSPTSTCHSFSYFQGDEYLFSYRNW